MSIEPQFISDPHRTFSLTAECRECGWTCEGWPDDVLSAMRHHTQETSHAE